MISYLKIPFLWPMGVCDRFWTDCKGVCLSYTLTDRPNTTDCFSSCQQIVLSTRLPLKCTWVEELTQSCSPPWLGIQKTCLSCCYSGELFYLNPLHVLVVTEDGEEEEEDAASAKLCQPDSAQFLIALRLWSRVSRVSKYEPYSNFCCSSPFCNK